MKPTSSSRRIFLRHASIITAATAGVVNFSDLTKAETTSPIDQVQQIELGVKPDVSSRKGIDVHTIPLTVGAKRDYLQSYQKWDALTSSGGGRTINPRIAAEFLPNSANSGMLGFGTLP